MSNTSKLTSTQRLTDTRHVDITKLHDRLDRREAAIATLRDELRACRGALGQAFPTDEAALDALSAVDFAEIDADNDVIPPTYRLHGLTEATTSGNGVLAGSVLLGNVAYRPRESDIAEDQEGEEEEVQDDDDEQDDEEDQDYRAKKGRRTSTSSRKQSFKA